MAQQYGKWRRAEGKLIGQGGQAILYPVYEEGKADLPEYRHVLKRLKNTDNMERMSRFKQEMQIGLTLSHENIIKVIEHDIDFTINGKPHPYFVTEYCSGGSLESARNFIQSKDLQGRLKIFLSICHGVAYAHQCGIVHRDLKPDNIFLREPGQVPVVGDFGLCFMQNGERLTMTHEQVGSRFYMAPEMADGKAENVGPQCDVYSLGKILYWLISGGIPLEREKHREPRFDLSTGRPDPEYVVINTILDKMITEEPTERFPNAARVAQAIEWLINRVNSGSIFNAPTLSLVAPEALGQTPITSRAGTWKIKCDQKEIAEISSGRGSNGSWGRFQKWIGSQLTISLLKLEAIGRIDRSCDNFLEFNLEDPLPFSELEFFNFRLIEKDSQTAFSAYLRFDYNGSTRWLCFSSSSDLRKSKDFTNPEGHRELILPLRPIIGDNELNVLNLLLEKSRLDDAWKSDGVNASDCLVTGLRFRGAFSLAFVHLG